MHTVFRVAIRSTGSGAGVVWDKAGPAAAHRSALARHAPPPLRISVKIRGDLTVGGRRFVGTMSPRLYGCRAGRRQSGSGFLASTTSARLRRLDYMMVRASCLTRLPDRLCRPASPLEVQGPTPCKEWRGRDWPRRFRLRPTLSTMLRRHERPPSMLLAHPRPRLSVSVSSDGFWLLSRILRAEVRLRRRLPEPCPRAVLDADQAKALLPQETLRSGAPLPGSF